MRKQTVLLVMALCIMGIVTCVMWGERDAERALRSSAESRLAQTREQLIQAQALQEDAEDALSAGKETWQEQLATVTAERDELSVSNAALQAQAEEAANALAQVQTQQESLEASRADQQAQKDELEGQKAELNADIEREQINQQRVSRDEVLFFLSQFKGGDPDDPDYKQRLVDTFVNSVWLYDDKLVLTYNYSGDDNKITLDLVDKALSGAASGCSDNACQAPPK